VDPKPEEIKKPVKIKKNGKKKVKDSDFNFGEKISSDPSSDSEDDLADANYVEMIREALRDTRHQLGVIDNEGSLYHKI
jgi:hypothetical protein